jgi:uncharacterized protein YecE (DUF72 family)
MKKRDAQAFVGTSGFAYDKWHGIFYPEDVDKKRLLEYYARFFNSVEINNSFYSLPSAKTVKGWQAQVPPSFRLCLKISRFLTHNKKLLESDIHSRKFMAMAKNLARSRGPLLLQLPPRFRPQFERLDETLAAFRKNARGWQVAVEVRQPDWYGRELDAVLDRHKAALVLHDMPGSKCFTPNAGADFVYIRFHGPKGDYHGKYGKRLLAAPARRMRGWLAEGKDVYAFFNNDADGFAPFDAQTLYKMVTPPSLT